MNIDNEINKNKNKRNYLLITVIIMAFSLFSIVLSFFLVSFILTDNKNSIENSTSNQIIESNRLDSQRGSVNNDTNNLIDEKQIPTKYVQHLCGSSFEKISEFIVEYSIPFPCSQPVGITIDNNDKAWIAATWPGYLVVFDPKINYFSEFIKIPSWKTKGMFGSMIWGMKFDKNGDLWFTDQEHNAIWRYFVNDKKFEMYKIPTRGAYPSSIEFDSEGNIWFSEIFGKKLGSLNPILTE
ncbi:MAG TPA: hypothetical protein VJ697_12940, partial [Nitrososphaeraceae archaeon]|nr:hypothetical protein [Nitrososphaeraceae archaeon]